MIARMIVDPCRKQLSFLGPIASKRFSTLCNIVASLVLFVASEGKSLGAEEAWIKYDSTESFPGAGTPEQPYIVNPGAGFHLDDIMALLTTAVSDTKSIRILAGVYPIAGAVGVTPWKLKANQRLIGSGRNSTVLSFNPTASSTAFALNGSGDGIEIADLKIDGLATPSIARSGISLEGSGCTIRNVQIVGVGGSTSKGIYMRPSSGADSVGNKVSDCSISLIAVSGAPGTGIRWDGYGGTRWISGSILNNNVSMPVLNLGAGITLLDHAQDTIISQNTIYGGLTGISVGAPCRALIVNANNVKDVYTYGCYLVSTTSSSIQNVTISYNTFQLHDSASGTKFAIYAYSTAPASANNATLSIIGNTMIPTTTVTGMDWLGAVYWTGLVVTQNRAHPAFISINVSNQGVNAFQNYKLDGTTLAF